MKTLERRTWVYAQKPKDYNVAPCSCGSVNSEWSEYKEHLWCIDCEKDFIPIHWGILDGPILFNLLRRFSVSFDRIDIATDTRIPFDLETGAYNY